jgi:hypothetical protein
MKSFRNVSRQLLAQSLEELEMVSQQVSASVSEVTVARNEKAEVLFPMFSASPRAACGLG